MPAMADGDMKQLLAEQERILAMPGRLAWAKLARLNRTAKIFRGNSEALLDHLKRMDDPGQMLTATRNQQALEEFLDETERHLHNYVAAAQSRVEHFRIFKRDDMPEGFRAEYQQRVDDEFKASPLHRFVIDLRILMLHIRLPVSTTTETWELRPTPSFRFQVMLDSDDLLRRWDRWSSEAEQYIQASGKSVDLGTTVATYTEKVIVFDRWVAERCIGEQQKEIDSYLTEVRQFQERLRRSGLRDYPEMP